MEPLSTTSQTQRLRRHGIRLIVSLAIFGALFFIYLNTSSYQFPVGSIFTVQSGATLSAVAKDLKAQHIVRSVTLFQLFEILFSGENKLIAGDYYFKFPISTYSVARRIMHGNFDLAPIRITIPEGSSMRQIADIVAPRLPHFRVADFMKFYPEKEGYLFPDTYFFISNASTSDVIETMQKNFEEKNLATRNKIEAFGKSENEVITMASILEEEAQTPTDWRIIAGILWKRLKIGMPLQVDSTFGLGSKYDTYTNKGLPPTPISNPGLQTIEAAVTPTTTKYFYYLSDKNGVIYYATTFAEHILNKQKYLK